MNTRSKFCAAALTACALLLTSPSLSSSALAESVVQTGALLQTAKQANMRKEPDKQSNIRETLKADTRVEVLDRIGDGEDAWAYIRVVDTDKTGYIMVSLLEPVPTPSPSPSPTPVPTPTPLTTATPVPTPTPDGSYVTGETVYEEERIGRTEKNANIRRTPGGKRLTQIPSGERLRLLGEIEQKDERWLHIVVNETGMEGYMLSEFIRQLKPPTLVETDAASVRERYPVLSCDPIHDIQVAEPFAYTEEELADYDTLRAGDSSEAVRRLKQRLYELGYFKKENNNVRYTDSTAEIIEIFQRDNGLPVTGEADPHTQAALFDERALARAGSSKEIKYLDNRSQPLYIQKAEVTSSRYHGSIQVSVRNHSGKRLTAFGLKIIPYLRDGSPADMKETFAEEIERVYAISDISIEDGNNYSDFWVPEQEEEEAPDDGVLFPELEDDGAPTVFEPHHFQVSKEIYFSSAQAAICWYRAGGKKVVVDDDQLVFVGIDDGVGESLIHTLPVPISDSELANADWALGVTTHYVLPVYQAQYQLPQGAWVKAVDDASPMSDAGIQPGDVIVGIGDITILGDATLRKARGNIDAGQSATMTFWRDGTYYETELFRPEAENSEAG